MVSAILQTLTTSTDGFVSPPLFFKFSSAEKDSLLVKADEQILQSNARNNLRTTKPAIYFTTSVMYEEKEKFRNGSCSSTSRSVFRLQHFLVQLFLRH